MVSQSFSIRAESVHLDHINQSHSRLGSHISHEQETHNLRLEVDHLCKRLERRVHIRENRTPSSSQSSSSEGEQSYQRRSRTLPSESFKKSYRY